MKTLITWLTANKKNIIKAAKEHIAIVVALGLFFLSPYVLRLLDPTAGVYDAGVLQTAILTIILFTLFQWAVWQAVKNIWPALGKFFKTHFETDFNSLTSWQKIKISLFVYFFLFAALVMLSRVIP